MICSLKLRLLSRITPRNFADLDGSIVVLPTTRGLSVHFLFQGHPVITFNFFTGMVDTVKVAGGSLLNCSQRVVARKGEGGVHPYN